MPMELVMFFWSSSIIVAVGRGEGIEVDTGAGITCEPVSGVSSFSTHPVITIIEIITKIAIF